VDFLKSHPLVAVALGIGLGIVFAQQLKRVPGISKIPTV
jgi:hypothetical protein